MNIFKELYLLLMNFINFTEQIVTNMTKVKGSSIYFKSFFASYAVDGDFNQDNIRRCFHTAVKKTIKEAWLQIDLGRVYRVSSVKLWYRSDEECKYDDIVHSTNLFKIISMQLI